MKVFILLLGMLKLNIACAQQPPSVSNLNDSAKQVRVFLVGVWQQDSSLNKIEFKSTGNALRLMNPDTYTYNFLKTNTYPLNGISMTWPPHDCQVKKISDNHIEITYTLFRGNPMSIRYKRLTRSSPHASTTA